MIAYKLVTITCTYFGLSGTVEDYLEGYEYTLFKTSHRKFFCWIDEWHGLNDEEIREYEKRVNAEMTEKMRKATGWGPVGQEAIENALKYTPAIPSAFPLCVGPNFSFSLSGLKSSSESCSSFSRTGALDDMSTSFSDQANSPAGAN